jgi:hypothetical protein
MSGDDDRRLIKATIPDQLLAEWFTKSLLPPISRDVAMGGVITEEEAISHAQYLDLVYSQSGTLYELILNAPHTSTDPSKPSSTSRRWSYQFHQNPIQLTVDRSG